MCKRAFSVAEHSMWVAKMVPQKYRLHALLHDAHEAYLSDIPKPLKENFPALRDAADKIDSCIYESLKRNMPDSDARSIVHMADEYSAWIEGRVLFVRDAADPWSPGTKPPDDLDAAREMYYDLQREPDTLYRIREAWMGMVAECL